MIRELEIEDSFIVMQAAKWNAEVPELTVLKNLLSRYRDSKFSN